MRENEKQTIEKQHEEINTTNQQNGFIELKWKVHLLKEEPKKMLILIPVILLSALLCYFIFMNYIYVIVTIALFIVSLADYLFPVRYTITEENASLKTLFSSSIISWKDVKKYYIDKNGIKLSPFNNQSRLEAYRGVYLRFGKDRNEIENAVRRIRDAQSAV